VISKEFEQALCAAFDAYESGLKAAREEMASDGRGGAITALQTVIQFTNAVPKWESQSLSLPLTALLSALHDLESGHAVEMLKPKEGIDHRRPEPGFRKVQRAVAIFCVDQLVAAGPPLEQACRFVAALLTRGGMAIGGRSETPPWQTVKTWRYETSRRDPDEQEADALNAFRSECAITPGMPLDDVRGLITRNLVSFLQAWSVGLG
jgi:hypothetical protein